MSNGDIITDLAALKANTLTLGADIGALKYDRSDNAYNAVYAAAAVEAATVADVGKDITSEATTNPTFAKLAQWSGVLDFTTSGAAVLADISEIRKERASGGVHEATVITTIGDTISLATSGTALGAKLLALAATAPEDAGLVAAAGAADGLWVAAGTLTGSAITAFGSVMNYSEAGDIVETATTVTYSNGLKGSWSNSPDGQSCTYQTWNPNTNEIVASVTVPGQNVGGLSPNGQTVTAGGLTERINPNGSLTFINASGEEQNENEGSQRVLENSGATYVRQAADGDVDITGNGIADGNIHYDADGSAQSASVVSSTGADSTSQTPPTSISFDENTSGAREEVKYQDPNGSYTGDASLYAGDGSQKGTENFLSNGSGQITSDTTQLNDGESIYTTHNYSSSGSETSYNEAFYDQNGDYVGSADYNATGGYISGSGDGQFAGDGNDGNAGDDAEGSAGDDNGGGDNGGGDNGGGDNGGGDNGGGDGGYGGYGGYDGGYQFTRAAKLKGVDIGAIAKLDKATLHTSGAATAADHARAQATALVTSHSTAAQFEGAKWALPQSGAKVVTWSLATLAGPKAAPFSSYMGARYTAEVEKAFAVWSKATGIAFKEVADGTSADIRVGFGDFDTATSGVAGYTSFRDRKGAIQAGAVVRIEDPSQDPLVHSASGGLKYSKSGINLQQLLEHEIGHALGFANNADPNSVMNYTGSSTAHGLDTQDKQAARSLYQGAAANDLHMTNYPTGGTASASLAQALAAFAPAAGSLSSLDHETSQSQLMQLAVNRHLPLAA